MSCQGTAGDEKGDGAQDMITNDLYTDEEGATEQSQLRRGGAVCHFLVKAADGAIIVPQGGGVMLVDATTSTGPLDGGMDSGVHMTGARGVSGVVVVWRGQEGVPVLRVLIESRQGQQRVQNQGLVLCQLQHMAAPEVFVEHAG